MAALLPILVFTATFLALAARRLGRVPLPRGPVALFGGLLMVLVGGLTPEAALASIDLGTLALLLGMMLLAGALAVSGLFELSAGLIARHVHNERQLIIGTLWGSAVLSALFLNDTVALFLPPVLFTVARWVQIDAFRTLAAAAIGVNLGSLWTPVGNPQNAYLATVHGIDFLDFFVHMTPIVLFGLLVATPVVAFRAGTTRFGPTPHFARVQRRLPLLLALVATLLTLVLFVLSPLIGMPLWAIAITNGSMVLLMVSAMSKGSPRAMLDRVDGNLLILFVGMFLLVRGATDTGLMDSILAVVPLAADVLWREVAQITLVTWIGSNLFSNVPAVLLLDAAVHGLGDPLYPQLLAAASTLSGNTTLLASAATLIVAEQAEAHGERFPFWRFTRLGVLITLLTLGFTIPYFVWLAS